MDMLVEIYRLFLFLRDSMFRYLIHLTIKSDVWRSISDNAVNIRQHNHLTIYTQEERKFHFSYHTFHVILCVMFDLHVPKIIAYLIRRVVLFLYHSSFLIHSIQETSILEGVIMEIFSFLLETFPVPASYFLLI